MADGNILDFPTRSGLRIIDGLRDVAAGRVMERAPADRIETEAEPPARIEITAGHTKVWAVRICGRIYAEFNSSTNAARVASALMTLDALDCLPGAAPAGPDAA